MPGSWLLGADLKDEHLHSIACLAAFIERKVNISALGALLGPVQKQRDELETQEEIMWVPIVMNIPDGGLVVWLRVEAEIFVDGAAYVGFQATRLLDVELEPRSGTFSKTELPELVVRAGYPSIALGAEGLRYGTEDVAGWGCSADIEDSSTRRRRHPQVAEVHTRHAASTVSICACCALYSAAAGASVLAAAGLAVTGLAVTGDVHRIQFSSVPRGSRIAAATRPPPRRGDIRADRARSAGTRPSRARVPRCCTQRGWSRSTSGSDGRPVLASPSR